MGGKGSKPEGARHAWAPRSLPRGVLPPDYVELRHPDGSVVHVVGVDYGSREGTVAARKVVRAANPDQTLLELCDDRVLPVWEILEHGGVSDSGKVSRPLPPLDTDSLQNDARLRKPGWWWLGGPYDAAFGAVVGTCSSSAQAACALESARLGAHTHLIDRKQSVTALRCFVGLLEVSRTGFVMPFQDLRVKADAALASATSASTADELQSARNDARAVLTAATAALMDGDAGGALEAVVRRTVVDERDQIFAHRCFEAAATLGAGGVIVAVVGKEHLPGIRAHWCDSATAESSAGRLWVG
ncbi:hypothetical protein M885DRAFT_228655 [Pelagophyceae sp. CCMP2097]|nr:hypothetical protein M885DRAFT_228655 [Pelagophyceae sp. CCMP2097]